jgi:lysozyme
MRYINRLGIQLIQAFEGRKLEAYQDQRGVWTIGVGHTHGVYPGMTMTDDQVDQALQDDLSNAEGVVDSATGQCPTTSNQYAAMVSLCFNIGSGNFRASSVLRYHQAGNYQVAAGHFLDWNKTHINGVLTEVPGLTRRRKAESQLYLIA